CLCCPLNRFFCSMMRPPPPSPLFPYTTLFRSLNERVEDRLELFRWDSMTRIDHLEGHRFIGDPTVQLYPIVRIGELHRVGDEVEDRKSTRLNSSHVKSSYAVFCLKKKNAFHTT